MDMKIKKFVEYKEELKINDFDENLSELKSLSESLPEINDISEEDIINEVDNYRKEKGYK